jgi:hypothetical protein
VLLEEMLLVRTGRVIGQDVTGRLTGRPRMQLKDRLYWLLEKMSRQPSVYKYGSGSNRLSKYASINFVD